MTKAAPGTLAMFALSLLAVSLLVAGCTAEKEASPADSAGGPTLGLQPAAESSAGGVGSSMARAGGGTMPSQPSGIQVTGTGSAMAKPDLALITLGVQLKNDSLAEAQEEAADRMSKVIKALRDGGVAEKDIATTSFSVYPERKYRDREVIGITYRVSHLVTVKVRKIESTGELLDAAVGAGANMVSSVSLTIDDPEPYQQQAREEAVKDARAKAEQLAQLSGVVLGAPTYIAESVIGVVPPVEFKAMAEGLGGGAPTPISVGELKVTVSVSILYGIE